MVALVGGAGPDASPAAAQPRTPSLSHAVREQMQPLAEQSEIPSPVPESSGAAEDAGDASSRGEGLGTDRAMGHSGGGQAGSEASGLVSSEQWAVIVSSIERVKSYPRLARERGIQGVVHVRFRLRPRGEVDRVEIVKSSGSEILDTYSVQTVYRAGPMPYVNGWVEVPIAYVLQ